MSVWQFTLQERFAYKSLEEPGPSVDVIPSTESRYITKSHECTTDSDWSHELWPGFPRFVVSCPISLQHLHYIMDDIRYHDPMATARKTRNAIIERAPFGLYNALNISSELGAKRCSHGSIDTVVGSSEQNGHLCLYRSQTVYIRLDTLDVDEETHCYSLLQPIYTMLVKDKTDDRQVPHRLRRVSRRSSPASSLISSFNNF
jgi:hypothetical protein